MNLIKYIFILFEGLNINIFFDSKTDEFTSLESNKISLKQEDFYLQ